MDIPCNNSTDPVLLSESWHLLSLLVPGCTAEFAVATIGIVNSIIVLIVSYRLDWFFQPYYTFLVNQAFLDLLSSLASFSESSFALVHYFLLTPPVMTEMQCLAIFAPINMFGSWSGKATLLVAIDRISTVMWPHRWLRSGMRHRIILMTVIFVWACILELTWLALIDSSMCVKLCFNYFIYPADYWWTDVVTANDVIQCVSIIVIYITLPFFSSTIFDRLNCSFLTVAIENLEEMQQDIIKRVRRLSLIVGVSYFCTTFIAFIIQDILPALPAYTNLNDPMVTVAPYTAAIATLNNVITLYLLTWKEKSFRGQIWHAISWMRRGRSGKYTVTICASGTVSRL